MGEIKCFLSVKFNASDLFKLSNKVPDETIYIDDTKTIEAYKIFNFYVIRLINKDKSTFLYPVIWEGDLFNIIECLQKNMEKNYEGN